jgi:hypothetical protein
MSDVVGHASGGTPVRSSGRSGGGRRIALRSSLVLSLLVLVIGGCGPGPRLLKPEDRTPIDRALVEYPAGYTFQPVVRNLTGATAITFDDQGNLIIAEGGDGELVRIYGFHLGGDGSRFDIYPKFRRQLPFPLKVLDPVEYRMYGPVGGLKWYNGRVYVSHRDGDRMGRITALTPAGVPTTIVAGLPAQGDYGVTDIAISPSGQLFFGVGSATNSGIVGPDNFDCL